MKKVEVVLRSKESNEPCGRMYLFIDTVNPVDPVLEQIKQSYDVVVLQVDECGTMSPYMRIWVE